MAGSSSPNSPSTTASRTKSHTAGAALSCWSQGMGPDDWGRTFVCENSDPYSLIMYDARYLARNPHMDAPPAELHITPGGKPVALHRVSKPEPWRYLKYSLRGPVTGPENFTGGS